MVTKCSKIIHTSTDERWNWVKKSSVCILCLRKGHQVKNCRQRKQFDLNDCKLKYHTARRESWGELLETLVIFPVVGLPTLLNMHRQVDNFFSCSISKIVWLSIGIIWWRFIYDHNGGRNNEWAWTERKGHNPFNAVVKWWLCYRGNQYSCDCDIQGLDVGEKYVLINIYPWEDLKLPVTAC